MYSHLPQSSHAVGGLLLLSENLWPLGRCPNRMPVVNATSARIGSNQKFSV